MPENYKLIQSAKDRAVKRSGDTHVWNADDVTSKVEYPSGREIYKEGFKDYHGSNPNDKAPN